ncbi:MAG: peptidylprolyl isomerase [candidate division Zixibacteria bacterium]|nr:peptidylprolyl isomerase [candidate division Zixibacteria bacterium]MBU1470451.1 peptidylprolyl isomerase [candidate division Zixibacteria bacterium]MBU2625900.1 peptidylprolyl isomerase [candidate division Zixibacteria bacterium]
MSQAKAGDKVRVHYTGKLEDGSIFDSSRDRTPLEFVVGSGSVIPGFDDGVKGMEIGSTKTVTIPEKDAYGSRRTELVTVVQKSEFPDTIAPEIGKKLQVGQPDGRVLNVAITGIDGEAVTLDANHPLAGKTLIFEIELVEIAA